MPDPDQGNQRKWLKTVRTSHESRGHQKGRQRRAEPRCHCRSSLQRTGHCAGSSVAVAAVAVKVAKVVLASTLAAAAVVTVAVDSVVPAAVLVAVSMHTVVKDCVVLVTVLVPVAAVAVEVDSVVLVSVPVVVAAQVS